MSLTAIAFWVVLLLLAGYAVVLYNGLVRLKHAVGKAWANIDVLLKQRHDELPKLVEACKQYMQHERATLERVIAARNAVASARERADVNALGKAESGLRAGLGQLFALAENYPQLKANESFQFLSQRISGLENGIADRRELYNEAVNLNNVRIEQFPDLLIARVAGFKAAELIEELAHEALGQGLEAAIGQFDLHYSLEPLLRRADHLLMSRTIEARTPYLHGALAQRAGRLQRIVGDTAKAPLVALLEQREKRWQAQPKRHFRLPFERWPQALGEMRRHLAERLPALHDLGLEGLDAPSVAALPGDQLFTLTTLSLWQQEYGASL